MSTTEKKKLECDCIVETISDILVFELKKKPLTRKARSGDSNSLIIDTVTGFLSAHNQCLKHEIELVTQGAIDLLNQQAIIHFNDRTVERIALTLTDYVTLHDRQFAQNFLIAMMTGNIEGPPVITTLIKQQNELRNRISALSAFKPSAIDILFYSTFMSIPQLLTILDDASSAEDLGSAFRQTRLMTTGTGDFLYEYKYARELAQNK